MSFGQSAAPQSAGPGWSEFRSMFGSLCQLNVLKSWTKHVRINFVDIFGISKGIGYSSHRGLFSGNAHLRGEVFHWLNKNGTKSSFEILSPVLSLEVGTQGKHLLVHCGSRGAFKTVNLVAKRQFSLDMRLSRPQVPHYVSSKMSGLSRPHKRGESTIPKSSTVKILAFNCRCGSLVPRRLKALGTCRKHWNSSKGNKRQKPCPTIFEPQVLENKHAPEFLQQRRNSNESAHPLPQKEHCNKSVRAAHECFSWAVQSIEN